MAGVYSFEQDEPAKLPRAYEKRLRENAAAWEYWTARPPGYRRTATRGPFTYRRFAARSARASQRMRTVSGSESSTTFFPTSRRIVIW